MSPMSPNDFTTEAVSNWCPGCGNFGILSALKSALAEMNADKHDFLYLSGIGCSSKIPHWVKLYGFHTIHGRPIAVATGAKLANHNLKVLVSAGDGDTYGIGTSHFIHAARRNIDMTVIVHNNQIYGLTKGQYSPSSEKGMITKTSPEGSIEEAFNPLVMALSAGASFVSRGYSADMQHLKQLIIEAINHKGFSLVDVLQPCVTFNHKNTYDWFKERVYKLEENGHDATDKHQAFVKTHEWGDKIPLGVLFKSDKPAYWEEIGQIKEMPLTKQPIEDIDIDPMLNAFL